MDGRQKCRRGCRNPPAILAMRVHILFLAGRNVAEWEYKGVLLLVVVFAEA
jgi:hypothetical protein